MVKTCSGCDWVGPVISEAKFDSAKDNNEQIGVMWTADAFASEIHGDDTEDWECTKCYWNGWWDI